LFIKIDHIENRIVLPHSLMETAGFLTKTLNGSIRHEVWQHIQDQYWVLEMRLRHAKHPDQIRQYENLYVAAASWF
jgi:hypothetical protein